MSNRPIGEWSWDKTAQTLSVSPKAGEGLGHLLGAWTLSDIAKTMDGLSGARLQRSFSAPLDSVSCEITLADGRRLNLIGRASDHGAAGLIVAASEDVSGTEPGPALSPVYQPIFDVAGQRIVGFEALARWEGADLSSERLEDTALASNMLIRACNALSLWRDETGREDLFVQVNMTGQDLADQTLPDLVAAMVSGYGLDDGQLRLELTEQAALRNTDGAIAMARALKDAGARLVLDDFGSGHSSFLWLAKLPADSLKVDAALIAEIETMRVQTILRAISMLARNLGMGSVAEGVESRDMLSVLADLGFDHVQGYALGRPMPAREALKLLT
ncbi:MAG: EAL domain-containing protein [Pseudomonadota bacterium]